MNGACFEENSLVRLISFLSSRKFQDCTLRAEDLFYSQWMDGTTCVFEYVLCLQAFVTAPQQTSISMNFAVQQRS